jgi:hypothetical protein
MNIPDIQNGLRSLASQVHFSINKKYSYERKYIKAEFFKPWPCWCCSFALDMEGLAVKLAKKTESSYHGAAVCVTVISLNLQNHQ